LAQWVHRVLLVNRAKLALKAPPVLRVFKVKPDPRVLPVCKGLKENLDFRVPLVRLDLQVHLVPLVQLDKPDPWGLRDHKVRLAPQVHKASLAQMVQLEPQAPPEPLGQWAHLE
jgi:hypothetical protein